MYQPTAFIETDLNALTLHIDRHPLAVLVQLSSDGLNANHIPLLWHDDGSEFGALRGHVARANPMWRDFDENLNVNHNILAVFQGDSAYISPSWYATKAENHKVVPTYNYATVHAHGELVVHNDAAWLLQLLNDLTDKHEAKFDTPWSVNDAPADYITRMIKAIVGIEIRITRLSGKWKVGQDEPSANQRSVLNALHSTGDTAMATLVEKKLK